MVEVFNNLIRIQTTLLRNCMQNTISKYKSCNLFICKEYIYIFYPYLRNDEKNKVLKSIHYVATCMPGFQDMS
jgi:hypothetical protein